MYNASEKRYENMIYNRCGNSGLKLPAVSLGLWHNFGDTGSYETMKQICCTAFDNGVTHFDLANNYGPEPGSAEKNFGRILKEDLEQYRDELIISTKAGYDMWPEQVLENIKAVRNTTFSEDELEKIDVIFR